MADLGEGMLMFLIGLAVGGVVGVGVSSFLRRAFGGLFSFFATPRERAWKRRAAEYRAQAGAWEGRVRRKNDYIRQALITVQHENRDRVERMLRSHSRGTVDLVLRMFRRPEPPVPKETIERCREVIPETMKYLEKALKS